VEPERKADDEGRGSLAACAPNKYDCECQGDWYIRGRTRPEQGRGGVAPKVPCHRFPVR
jgi:hypothetical protein